MPFDTASEVTTLTLDKGWVTEASERQVHKLFAKLRDRAGLQPELSSPGSVRRSGDSPAGACGANRLTPDQSPSSCRGCRAGGPGKWRCEHPAVSDEVNSRVDGQRWTLTGGDLR